MPTPKAPPKTLFSAPSSGCSSSVDGEGQGYGQIHPPPKWCPNSHLSLLAMVDCWAHLGINPHIHLFSAAMPIFRLFLGMAEHLLLSPALLSAFIHSSLFDTWHRAAAFCEAGLRGWEARCGDDQDGHGK
ncbi:hypothetical protein BJ912DRAFT_521965 [Pholiota molesta]|nr:hypothetical protein BJ912DRAFT_521965 [Pholiota molesta]